MEKLFDWHNQNAKVLLSDSSIRQRFVSFLSKVDRIILHEDFAGMGTAGAALCQQLQAFISCLQTSEPHTEGFSAVEVP